MGCDTQLVGEELEYASCNTRELPPELTSAITSGPANKSEWTAKPPIADASPPEPSRLFGVVPRCSALLAGAEPALCATADPAVSAWPAASVSVKLAGEGVLPVNVELLIDC